MKSNRAWVIVVAIIAVIIAAFAYIALYRPDKKIADTQQPPTSTRSETPETTATTSGKYIEYTAQSFAAAKDARRLLFFHAPWCPQCRALEQSIMSSGVPQNTIIFKVDYDTASELKKRYSVTLQTTVVEVNGSDELKKKIVAYDDPSLDFVLKALEQ